MGRGERESKDGKAQTFPRQHMRFHVSFSLESRCLGKVWKGNLASARTSVRNLLSILHLPATRINPRILCLFSGQRPCGWKVKTINLWRASASKSWFRPPGRLTVSHLQLSLALGCVFFFSFFRGARAD